MACCAKNRPKGISAQRVLLKSVQIWIFAVVGHQRRYESFIGGSGLKDSFLHLFFSGMADEKPEKKHGCLFKGWLSVSSDIQAAAKRHVIIKRSSGRVAIVVIKVAAEARPCCDITFASSHVVVCKNDAAIQSLMVSFRMVVFHILPDRETKMFLSKGNDLVQTLGLRAGNRTGFVPLSLSMFLKQALNSGSLSMMRYRASCNRYRAGNRRKDR